MLALGSYMHARCLGNGVYLGECLLLADYAHQAAPDLSAMAAWHGEAVFEAMVQEAQVQ